MYPALQTSLTCRDVEITLFRIRGLRLVWMGVCGVVVMWYGVL